MCQNLSRVFSRSYTTVGVWIIKDLPNILRYFAISLASKALFKHPGSEMPSRSRIPSHSVPKYMRIEQIRPRKQDIVL